MEKTIWSEVSLNQPTSTRDVTRRHGREPGSLDAARGLMIGLAISQVFWLILAACIVLFLTHRI